MIIRFPTHLAKKLEPKTGRVTFDSAGSIAGIAISKPYQTEHGIRRTFLARRERGMDSGGWAV
jgi:hypothetical protein